MPIPLVGRLLAGESPVKARREHHGLTLAELAEKSAISEDHLSGIENGERKGSIAMLTKLATALAIDIDDLIPT